VDRSALARLEPAGGAAPREGAPPRTDLERGVAAVWCEILGLETVARDESFFDLGGHSLLLARMQARLAETLGREVPLLKIFEHPTVEALAAWLEMGEDRGATAEGAEAPSRERADRQRQSLEMQRRRLAGRGGREAVR
jgi:acyl carrier protein